VDFLEYIYTAVLVREDSWPRLFEKPSLIFLQIFLAHYPRTQCNVTSLGTFFNNPMTGHVFTVK